MLGNLMNLRMGSGLGDSKAPKQPQLDVIQRIMGAFGRYHLFLCLLIMLTKFAIAFHQMAILFLAPKVSYTCGGGGGGGGGNAGTGSENAESLRDGGAANTCPCPNPVYDTSLFTRTIIMKWDLICDKKWLTSFAQTIFQLGTLIGSVLFGMASDRFGRKYPLLVAIVIQVSMGITAAFVPSYWAFTVLRFLVGISVGGTMVIGFVIIMEFVGAQYRDVISAVYQIPFNMGHMLLPVFGYFIRDYSKFQMAISIPTIILLSYLCLLPETPRWLIAVKRTEEAIKVIENVAKVNNRPTANIQYDVQKYQAALQKTQLKKGTIVDLFRTPNIRKNILAMAYNWLTCSYCFYGVSQYVGQLSGNVFINVAASASVTMLGSICSIPLMKVIGRKTILIIFNFICAACLFILAVIPEGPGTVVCASVGVVSSFIVFVVVYLYCTEMFPTVVRNAALGFSSMMARVGSMIAPFVIESSSRGRWVPPVLFAIVPLVAGFVCFLLPETKGCELMVTIEQGEQFGKKPAKK
ncbi:organic cation transporter protein-like [Leguminivora glycinivorella]|uniref:organic cation transporter protein-like n=1 Tax=Leguminivora glycinivorella TaxID=1035111 RepID=UPI00200C29B5|nr:organic cation transporter protein-like [Leguminivora glycinivorella]